MNDKVKVNRWQEVFKREWERISIDIDIIERKSKRLVRLCVMSLHSEGAKKRPWILFSLLPDNMAPLIVHNRMGIYYI